jgi:hypothetical protein
MITPVSPYDYIKSPSYETVYFIDEQMIRHPFMNRQTYFTYQNSFEPVKMVTDATLPTLTLGTPMSPKPFTVLVKIISSPRVYALGPDNIIRAIPDESTAARLFGSTWADYVIDVDPAQLAQFVLGAPMTGNETIDRTILRRRIDIQ